MQTNNISSRIKQLREKKGLSQNELARDLYVKQQTIAQWEKGERALKADAIISLSEYFGVTSDYLLGLTDSTSTDIDEIGISNRTGFSSNVIRNIINATQEEKQLLDTIVSNILNDDFIDVLCIFRRNNEEIKELCLNGTLYTKWGEDEYKVYEIMDESEKLNGAFIGKRDYSELCLFKLQNAIMNIIKDISGYNTMKTAHKNTEGTEV